MTVDLNDYFYFVHVVEKGGYTAAARSLNMPKSRLSRHISQLELRLGVRLLQRTSRTVKVTEEGKQFFLHARKLVDTMELAEASISELSNNLSGKVKFSCSTGLAQFALLDILCDFSNLHPNILVEQHISNTFNDIIEDEVDFAIRGHGKALPDSNLVKSFIAQVDWPFFCSPSYLNKIKTISTPCDLASCHFLKLGSATTNEAVSLQHSDGTKTHQKVKILMSSEDMGTLKHFATQGLGVTTLPDYVCVDSIKSGELVRILPEWISQSPTLSILMPSRLGIPQHTKILVEFIKEKLPLVTNIN